MFVDNNYVDNQKTELFMNQKKEWQIRKKTVIFQSVSLHGNFHIINP